MTARSKSEGGQGYEYYPHYASTGEPEIRSQGNLGGCTGKPRRMSDYVSRMLAYRDSFNMYNTITYWPFLPNPPLETYPLTLLLQSKEPT